MMISKLDSHCWSGTTSDAVLVSSRDRFGAVPFVMDQA